MSTLLPTGKLFLGLASLSGFLGVALGAFGAHALKARLSPEMLTIFETGVRYQMYHCFALLAVGILASQLSSLRQLTTAGWLFVAGTLIFSGSLYILSLSGVKTWGAVTPLGGLCLLAGWLTLGWAVWQAH